MTDIVKPIEPAAAATVPADGTAGLAIWDLPVRLFHWCLPLLLIGAWWTAEERQLEWHRLTGYAILTLIIWRLAWGIVGSSTARFTQFVSGPKAVLAYVRNGAQRHDACHPGHNPLGGWSVLAMIAALATQIMLGFFAVDVDGMESGPLSYLVDFDTGRLAANAHEIVFNILIGLVGLHIAAILFHRIYKREDLISPMVHGKKRWTGDAPRLTIAPSWLALLLLAGSVALVWLVLKYSQP